MRKLKGLMTVAATILAGSLALAACGGSEPASSSALDADNPTKVKVGIIPISNLTPLYYAQKSGIFKRNGLEVETTSATTGGTTVPALASNQLQFAYSDFMAAVRAQGQLTGDGFTIVAGQNSSQASGVDSMALAVAADSPHKTVADLAGQKIALNVRGNANEIATSETLIKAGVDPKTVTYVELAFPDMLNALMHGDVAAANMVEPFRSLAGDQLRALAYPFVDFHSSLPIAGWIASAKYVKENPDVVDAFVKSLDEANSYLNDNPQEKIKWVAEYTKSDEDTIKKLTLDQWSINFDTKVYQQFVDAAVKLGALEKPINVSDMSYQDER